MKQHMMTHKLRDVPQHMFSNKMDQSRNNSPDIKDTPSLRVKSEVELNPRSTSTPDRYDQRERSLPSHLQSQVCGNLKVFFFYSSALLLAFLNTVVHYLFTEC